MSRQCAIIAKRLSVDFLLRKLPIVQGNFDSGNLVQRTGFVLQGIKKKQRYY